MKLIQHQLNEPIDFTIPVSGTKLSFEDETEVIRMILKQWLVWNSPRKHFPGLDLLKLDWVWQDVQKRTLPQRIAYVLNKHKAIMHSPSFYGKMGNFLRETIPTSSTYLFDFTSTFDWKSGQYGDSRSCFMNGGSRAGVLREMERNGNFYAMRFYQQEPMVNHNGMILLANTFPKYKKDGKEYYGKGRVLLYYQSISMRVSGKMVKEPVYFMFNSYGKESLREMAAVFAAYVGASCKSIKLVNIGKACGGLYINSGSMIVGNKDAISTMNKFDFKFKTNYDQQLGLRRNDIAIGDPAHERIVRRMEKRRMPWDKFWYKKKKSKKARNTENKRRSQNDTWQHMSYMLQEVTREWFWTEKWTKGNAFQNLENPTKMKGVWKLLYYRYSCNFYQILIKLLQIKMNGGFNDNSPECKNTGKPKDECSQPTLRRDEIDMPDEYDFVELIPGPEEVHLEER